jgi:hypothetical protein
MFVFYHFANEICQKPYVFGFGCSCHGTAPANQKLFFSFGPRALFCAGVFAEQKYEFSGLNSSFSVRAFTGTARDALRY